MTDQTDEHMAYVAYCGDCGGMTAAVVDDPAHRKYSAKYVAKWMRDGDRIERVTCQFVRDNLTGCTDTCPCKYCAKRRKGKRDPASFYLFAETTER